MELVSTFNHISGGRDGRKCGSFTLLFPFRFLHELPKASWILAPYPHLISSYCDIPQMTLEIQVTVTVFCLGWHILNLLLHLWLHYSRGSYILFLGLSTARRG